MWKPPTLFFFCCSEGQVRLRKELMNARHRKNVERCSGDDKSRLLLLSTGVTDPDTLEGMKTNNLQERLFFLGRGGGSLFFVAVVCPELFLFCRKACFVTGAGSFPLACCVFLWPTKCVCVCLCLWFPPTQPLFQNINGFGADAAALRRETQTPPPCGHA